MQPLDQVSQKGSLTSFVDRITWQDVIKLLGLMIIVGVTWARIEARQDSLENRLTGVERRQDTYVTRELQEARQQILVDKLDNITGRIDRIEHKLDSSTRP